MIHKSVIVSCCAALSLVVAVSAQTPAGSRAPSDASRRAPAAQATPQTPTSQSTAAPARTQAAVPASAAAATQEKQLLDQYCLTCHSEKAKAAGMDSARKLAIDTLDVSNLQKNG